MKKKVLTCPVGHSKIWKKGFGVTRQGRKTRYVCQECGRTFYGTEKVEAFKKQRGEGAK